MTTTVHQKLLKYLHTLPQRTSAWNSWNTCILSLREQPLPRFLYPSKWVRLRHSFFKNPTHYYLSLRSFHLFPKSHYYCTLKWLLPYIRNSWNTCILSLREQPLPRFLYSSKWVRMNIYIYIYIHIWIYLFNDFYFCWFHHFIQLIFSWLLQDTSLIQT